jgi:hypothetical protein
LSMMWLFTGGCESPRVLQEDGLFKNIPEIDHGLAALVLGHRKLGRWVIHDIHAARPVGQMPMHPGGVLTLQTCHHDLGRRSGLNRLAS